MHLSSAILYKKEEADRIAISHTPSEIVREMGESAKILTNDGPEARASAFRLSDLVAEFTGIAQVEKDKILL